MPFLSRLKGVGMLRLILLALALGAPFATYAGMKVHEAITVRAAVAAERTRGIAQCQSDMAAMERAHNAQVDQAARDAEHAGDQVVTPQADEDIKALCKKSASCRDRG